MLPDDHSWPETHSREAGVEALTLHGNASFPCQKTAVLQRYLKSGYLVLARGLPISPSTEEMAGETCQIRKQGGDLPN